MNVQASGSAAANGAKSSGGTEGIERRLQTLWQKKAELMQQAAGAAKGGAEGSSSAEALQQHIQMIDAQIQTLEGQLSAAKTRAAEKPLPPKPARTTKRTRPKKETRPVSPAILPPPAIPPACTWTRSPERSGKHFRLLLKKAAILATFLRFGREERRVFP